jgi:hypothetical protein
MPHHKARPYLKNTKAKRACGMAQAIECLPGKCEVLSSNPSIAKNNNNNLEAEW